MNFKFKNMDKVAFETIHGEVVAAVEDRLLSKPQSTAFNILVRTRTSVDYKISKWKKTSHLHIISYPVLLSPFYVH